MNLWRRWLDYLKAVARKPRFSAFQGSTSATGAGQQLVPLSELAAPAAVLAGLVLLVLGSAMLVIHSAYEYRRLFNQHQILISRGDDLQVEWGQLLLEESAWSANNRVERLAEKKLNMKIPEPKEIEIVRHEPRQAHN